MRNSSNSKLIILSFLVVLCLFAFYRVTKHYSNQDIKPIIKDSINVADESVETDNTEVNLGDYMVGCATKDYSSCNAQCNIPGAYTACEACKSSVSACLTCPNDAFLRDKRCWKSETCEISVTSYSSHVSPGGRINVNIKYNGTGCSGKMVSVSAGGNCSGGGSISMSSSSGSGSVSLTAGGRCSDASFTVTGPGLSKSLKVAIVDQWKASGDLILSSSLPSDASQADQAGQDYYGNCSQNTNGTYTCTNVYSRACNGAISEVPACYADASLLSIATSAKWIRPSEIDNIHRVKVSSVTKESDCKVEKVPEYCNPSNKVCSKEEIKANSCEGNLNISPYEDGLSCTGKPFYTINCRNTPTVRFDNGDDDKSGEIIGLYPGQGFKYGITITMERSCTATFNKDNWKNPYDVISKKITQAKSDLTKASSSEKIAIESKIKWLENIQNDLKNAVTTYNNYNPSTSYNESGKIVIEYKTSKEKSKHDEVTFETKILQEGSGKRSNNSEVNLGISGITNPHNYTWSNTDNPRKVKLSLPKAYIDEKTGKVETAGLDGGNKLYLDYDTIPGTYAMTITLSGIGCNSDIINDKCSVKVDDLEIIYRPIDVSNPFINNKWTPGTNWVNSQFDFRNIIHSDIWSK